MGVSYYANTVIGVEIDPEKLYSMKKVKAFEHDYDESWKHDPKTGKPLWVVKPVPAPGVEVRNQSYVFNLDDGDVYIAGYKVVAGPSNSAFIAAYHTATSSWSKVTSEQYSAEELNKVIEKFKDDLIKVGFWDSGKFGVHTFIEVNG